MPTNEPTGNATPGISQLKTLRGALEHSVTVQRDRLQEVVDELVSRGALSAAEANKLVETLLTSSRTYSAVLLQVLDSAASETRKGVEGRIAPVVASAGKAAGKVADTVLAAPKLVAGRRRARTGSGTTTATAPASSAAQRTDASTASSTVSASSRPGEPIPGYSGLTVAQVRPRLAGLSPEDLRRVRDLEAGGKKRKSLLAEIDKLLGS